MAATTQYDYIERLSADPLPDMHSSRDRSAASSNADSAFSASARQQIKRLGIDDHAIALLATYLAELEKWNRAYNLTAIRDPAEMVTRHLLDSLAVLPHLPDRASDSAHAPLRLLDVGSGGGMPGILLAIVRPQWQVTVLDGNGKKARFLRHVVRALALSNVQVAESRVEAWIAPQLFDRIISRAFAALAEFVQLSDHLLIEDGRWLAMKGKVASSELAELPANRTVETIHALEVPGLQEARSLIVVRRHP
jgi:16S rRNA (guanine527-N7)-methyltransferase